MQHVEFFDKEHFEHRYHRIKHYNHLFIISGYPLCLYKMLCKYCKNIYIFPFVISHNIILILTLIDQSIRQRN